MSCARVALVSIIVKAISISTNLEVAISCASVALISIIVKAISVSTLYAVAILLLLLLFLGLDYYLLASNSGLVLPPTLFT